MGDYPGLSEWVQYNHRGPPEAGRRVRVREEEGTTRQRSESCEVGPTSRGMQGPLGARKGEEDSPLEPPEDHGSADTSLRPPRTVREHICGESSSLKQCITGEIEK